MTEEFKPLDTTMGSFQASENAIFNYFVGQGRAPETAKRIAHVFTQYVLNYFTFEIAVKKMSDAGLPEKEAYAFIDQFRQARKKYVDEHIMGHGQSGASESAAAPARQKGCGHTAN